MLCSLAGDLRITQTVNGNKGVHMMMAKTLLETVWLSWGGRHDDISCDNWLGHHGPQNAGAHGPSRQLRPRCTLGPEP
jgi:hypothetical protein